MIRNRLSTPHGTLGTNYKVTILNSPGTIDLSTPHGTLGTSNIADLFDWTDIFQLHTVH